MATTSVPGEPLTIQSFKDRTGSVRARKIEQKYKALLNDATEHGCDIATELTTNYGCKSLDEFFQTCPTFNLMCWPAEMAELGSGIVLYFQLLAFLAGLMLLFFLLHIPMMAAYSGYDSLEAWHWHSWSNGYKMSEHAAEDRCSCTGSNGNVGGPSSGYGVPGYGTYCSKWDYDLCKNSNVPFENRGKWCCRAWCFASSECRADEDKDSPSLSNVHYEGMVRAYSTCTQDDSFTATNCGDYPDTAFSENGTDTASYPFIAQSWLTPGNVGPDGVSWTWVPVLYVIMTALMVVFLSAMHQHQIMTDSQVDAGSTSPNDFAILVKNVLATDEKQIMKFFEEHAVRGAKNTEIVKVVIGWDPAEFSEAMTQLRELTKQLATMEEGPEKKVVEEQKKAIYAMLMSAAPERAARLVSSGVVVVVFRHQSDLRKCLEKWTGFWQYWFYCEAQSILGGVFAWKGDALPRFPIGDPPIPMHRLVIDRAPNPGDIYWEMLGKSPKEKFLRVLATFSLLFLMVVVCFLISWGCNKIEGGSILSLLPGFITAVFNGALSISAKLISKREYHTTKTEMEFSLGLKLTIAMTVNVCGVVFFVNARPDEWYKEGGLVDDLFLVLVVTCFVVFPIQIMDIAYLFKTKGRQAVTEEKIKELNGQITAATTAQEKKAAQQKVDACMLAFEPSEISMPRRYANALKTFFSCLIFTPLVPWVSLVGAAALITQYYVDKYLVTKWYKRPTKPQNAAQAMLSLRKVCGTFGPLAVALSYFVFLCPSWDNKNVILSSYIPALIIALISSVLPSSVLRSLFGFRCMMGKVDVDTSEALEDYYKAQYLWSKQMKYHKDHFLYKFLPESTNPEFFTEHSSAAVSLSDVQKHYGTSTKEAADTVDESTGPMLRGGRMVATSRSGSTGHKPEAGEIGRRTLTEDKPSVVEVRPRVPPDHYSVPPAVTAAVPVWEYDRNGFVQFNSDCQSYIERKFQEFKATGRNMHKVNTCGKTISVDFQRMTQKDGKKILRIRRDPEE